MHQLYTRICISYPEAIARNYSSIHFRMQIRKATSPPYPPLLERRGEGGKREIFECVGENALPPQIMHQLYTRICISYPEALAGNDPPIHLCMQIRKAARELHFLAIHRDAAVGGASAVAGLLGQVLALQGKLPAHIGIGQFQLACHAPRLAQRHRAAPHITEPPEQQIEEMHADVGCYAARFFGVAFPGIIIPKSPRCDIGQLDLVTMGKG